MITCNHCGSQNGYFVKEEIKQTVDVYYNAKGEYDDEANQHTYDFVYDKSFPNDGNKYCINCEKTISEKE